MRITKVVCTFLIMLLSITIWSNEVSVAQSKQEPVYDYSVFSLNPKDFYSQLDYKISGLKDVKTEVDAGDYKKAGIALHKYFLTNKELVQKIFKIQAIRQSKSKQPAAEQLLNRTYAFQGVTYTFKDGIDWLYNPTGKDGLDLNPEWVVNTVRFRGLPFLAKAYRETGDERYAIELVYLMRDFIAKFPVPLNEKQAGNNIPSEFDRLMYSKLSVSSRLQNTVYSLFSVLESSNLKSEDFVIILQGVYNHLLRMEKYPYLNYHNMGVADAYVLQQVALAFPEFKRSGGWASWALKRGLDQMEHVVYPDGVEKELCPRYHQGVMSEFAKFMEVSRFAGNKTPVEFIDKLKSMARFLADFSRPNGSIPAFNEMVQNSDEGEKIRQRVRNIANVTNDNEILRWFGSNGTQGAKPGYGSVAFKWSGYYVMRSGWAKNDNYMAIKAGPYGLAHQQEDKLSFELFANGEPFLIDPGFYIYNKASVWRKYYRSSLAHNTVVPNGLSQLREGQRSLYENKKPNDALWISNDEYDFLSAIYNNGYSNFNYIGEQKTEELQQIKHQRDVLFVKPGVWLMIDWMQAEKPEKHLYEALFQSEYPVTVSGKNLIIKGKNSNLFILPVEAEGKTVEASIAIGQAEPVRRGWIYKVDKKENQPISTGVISQKAAGSTGQAYFIIPGKGYEISSYKIKMFHVEGGIGGELTSPEGILLKFIAQQYPGKTISASGLKTSARMKFTVSNEKTIEIN